MPHTQTVTVKLPTRFYDDHADRGLPAGDLVKRTKRYVVVELDAAAYGELISDAEHYADRSQFDQRDPFLRGLCTSAKATVCCLRAIETPWTREEASLAAEGAELARIAHAERLEAKGV